MAKSANKDWSFAVKIVAPVVAVGFVSVLACFGFMLWSAGRIDAGAIELQKRVVTHLIAQEKGGLTQKLGEYATWDEAVTMLQADDKEWIAANLGADAFRSEGYDRAYLLKADLTPTFAMRRGGKVDGSTYAEDADAIRPIIDKLTSVDGQAAIAAYNEGVADAPVSTDMALIDDRVAVVSAVPLLGSNQDTTIDAKDAFIYVAVHFLTGAPEDIARESPAIGAGVYVAAGRAAPGDSMIPVQNAAGETIGNFAWTADRPAVKMTLDALPALGIVALIVAMLMARLLWRLRQATAELEQAREQAVHLALHDPLTGLANRAMFQKRLTSALENLNRDGSPIALLALDLDRFKEVNDRLGHEAGDELLRQVARRLMSLLDDHDTVARLGGDEFIVLQNAIRTVSETRHLSERIIEAIGAPYRVAEQDVTVGVSIGVAIAHDAARDGLDLPARADFALYQAKESGRNTYRVYEGAAARPARRATDAA
jgi:diguanylate cyclase (GGDEF)-like protein